MAFSFAGEQLSPTTHNRHSAFATAKAPDHASLEVVGMSGRVAERVPPVPTGIGEVVGTGAVCDAGAAVFGVTPPNSLVAVMEATTRAATAASGPAEEALVAGRRHRVGREGLSSMSGIMVDNAYGLVPGLTAEA
jgi:hypothetical protein